MITLKKITEIINGELKGDPDYGISSVNSLQRAGKHEITFCIKDTIKPETIFAGALIVKRESRIDYPNLIFVNHPYGAFSRLLDYFHPHQRFSQGIDPAARVSKKSKIGKNVSIGAFSYVGEQSEIGEHTEIHSGVMIYRNVKIGKYCMIYANVVIREDVEIGDHTIIQPGAVIGADGFGFTRNADGTVLKIPQKGRVIIGKYCEIGSNTCIDRSTIENTIIKDFVKTDNLVQIGHNVTVGQNTMLSAQTGISGSTEIGADVVMGGQVGIGDHLKIADGVMMAGKTGVTGSIRNKSIVAGYPHQEIKKWRREQVLIRNLEHHIDRIKILEEKLKKLEEK